MKGVEDGSKKNVSIVWSVGSGSGTKPWCHRCSGVDINFSVEGSRVRFSKSTYHVECLVVLSRSLVFQTFVSPFFSLAFLWGCVYALPRVLTLSIVPPMFPCTPRNSPTSPGPSVPTLPFFFPRSAVWKYQQSARTTINSIEPHVRSKKHPNYRERLEKTGSTLVFFQFLHCLTDIYACTALSSPPPPVASDPPALALNSLPPLGPRGGRVRNQPPPPPASTAVASLLTIDPPRPEPP